MTPTTLDPCSRQCSAYDARDRFSLFVLAKRTYDIGRDGRCTPAALQTPLIEQPLFDAKSGLLSHDCDLYPIKPRTDVILAGHAYLDRVRDPGPSAEVVLRIDRREVRSAVFGDRTCRIVDGQVAFSPQVQVERIPLDHSRAYGGRDTIAEKKHGNPALKWASALAVAEHELANSSPFLYPRNFAGRGYLIEPTPEAIAQLRLPNLEDPAHLLSPSNIVVGSVERWASMPMPAAFGWVHPMWFPRLPLMGIPCPSPAHPGEAAESALGLPAGLLRPTVEHAAGLPFCCGAPPRLQWDSLRGDEQVVVAGALPAGATLSFRLPGERPRLWVDGRNGKLKPAEPTIHTITIEPDSMRLTMLWRGSAPALRLYLDDELETMPYRVAW